MSIRSPGMNLMWSYRVPNKAYHGCSAVLACVSSPLTGSARKFRIIFQIESKTLSLWTWINLTLMAQPEKFANNNYMKSKTERSAFVINTLNLAEVSDGGLIIGWAFVCHSLGSWALLNLYQWIYLEYCLRAIIFLRWKFGSLIMPGQDLR